MIFGLVKLVVWIAGVGFLTYLGLPFFGYAVNLDYFKESRVRCEEELKQCQKELIQSGLTGVRDRCEWKCADPKFFIRTENAK